MKNSPGIARFSRIYIYIFFFFFSFFTVQRYRFPDKKYRYRERSFRKTFVCTAHEKNRASPTLSFSLPRQDRSRNSRRKRASCFDDDTRLAHRLLYDCCLLKIPSFNRTERTDLFRDAPNLQALYYANKGNEGESRFCTRVHSAIRY